MKRRNIVLVILVFVLCSGFVGYKIGHDKGYSLGYEKGVWHTKLYKGATGEYPGFYWRQKHMHDEFYNIFNIIDSIEKDAIDESLGR